MIDPIIIKNWHRDSQWSSLRKLSVDERIDLHAKTFADWDTNADGPAPIWIPTLGEIEATNLHGLMKQTGHSDLVSLQTWWQNSPEDFWSVVTESLPTSRSRDRKSSGAHEIATAQGATAPATSNAESLFAQPPRCALEFNDPRNPTWFPDAKLNIAKACLSDLAVTLDDPAIKYAAADGQINELSYGQLRDKVQLFAGRIRDAGFKPGDRIAIVMPMNMMSVVVYLGVLYSGCAAVSIADSFASGEIAKRLRISEAKGVFYSDSYQRAGKTIVLGKNVIAAKEICEAEGQSVQLFSDSHPWPEVDSLDSPHIAGPDHVINILFSSGTTGDPKAIPWDQTTPIKCAADGKYHHDIQPGDVVVWPTNLGWMMGPWLIFATLMNKGTIGLFEDAPTGEAFGKFVQDAQTTMLGVVPALVRHWKKTRCMEPFDWSSIKCFSSTGEASNEQDMTYLSALAGFKPIIEYCGGTEVGGGYISSTLLQSNVPAAFSTVAVGSRFVMLDEAGKPNDEGEIYLVPPTIGLSRTLLNRDHFKTYYADVPKHELPLRRHGDRMQQLPGGYYRACGRMDDTMNPGGIKVGSAELETIINDIEGVEESAVIAVSENGSGPDQLLAFVVAKSKLDNDNLLKTMNSEIRKQLNPLIRIAAIRKIERLPRTASNKIMRRKLRDIETE